MAVRIKIKSKLLIGVFSTATVSILLVGFLANSLLLEQSTNTTMDRLESIAAIQEKRIEEVVERNLERLESVTSSTQLRLSVLDYLANNNVEELKKIDTMLTDTLESVEDFNSISIYSTDGKEIINVAKPSQDIIPNRLYQVENPFEKNLNVEYYQGKPTMYLTGPLVLNENIIGVLTINSNTQSISSIVSDYSGLGETGETILAKRTQEGEVIFITPSRFGSKEPNPEIKDQLELPISQALLAEEMNMKSATDYRGGEVMAVTKHIDSVDWGLVTKIDSSEVYNLYFDIFVTEIGIFVVLIGVLGSMALVLTNQILQPIDRLKKIVKESERGNYNARVALNQNNEIGELTRAFHRLQEKLAENKNMTDRFRNRLQEKLKERDDLKNALDNSSIVVKFDKKGTITYANKKFSELTKYNNNELIGFNVKILYSGNHKDEFYKKIWNQIECGNVWHGNLQGKAKDGSFYWASTTVTPILGPYKVPIQYIAVLTDITKLVSQKDLIQKQFKELHDADIRKEEFSSMVSHELKTPVTPIKFNTEMLKEPGLIGNLNLEQLKSVQEIEQNATRLEELISDLLDAQKLDMNRLVFNKERVSIPEMIQQVTNNVKPLLKEKQVALYVDMAYKGEITSDKRRIQQILENLIKNSVDFVPEKAGKITVGVTQKKDFVLFYINDNGIGIPKEKQHNLFKKFYQVDTSHTRKHGGSGLGLVICKGFAEGLGGKIWFSSTEGRGATFFFTIPITEKIRVPYV